MVGPANEKDLLPLLERLCRSEAHQISAMATDILADIYERMPAEVPVALPEFIRGLASVEQDSVSAATLTLLVRFWQALKD